MNVELFFANFVESIIRISNDPYFLLNFLKLWGWAVFLWPFIWMAHVAFVYDKIGKDRDTWKWILLAIDVPKNNEQGPRAVENIFSHLAGAHGTHDIYEGHFLGATQKWFSFEIISIEGFVQFIVYTDNSFRSLIEASIYAQYPDAEITEVEDYTKGIPDTYPNNEYDVWGTDFKMTRPYYYPIRCYPEYEDKLAGVFHDPMSALIETMSRMGPGEQLWMQILVKPIGIEWKEHGAELVNKLAGKPEKHASPSVVSKVMSIPTSIGETILTHGFGLGAGAGDAHDKKDAMPSMLLHLTPYEKNILEAIEHKLSKIGFSCKIRILYVGKKGYFKKSNAVNAIVGAVKQFNTEHMNAIIPDMKMTAVTAHYVWVEKRKNWRKNRMMAWYKSRSIWCGTESYVLNIEELATLWHFPVTREGAPGSPMLAKTSAKKGDAPARIPTDVATPFQKKQTPSNTQTQSGPPANLPM